MSPLPPLATWLKISDLPTRDLTSLPPGSLVSYRNIPRPGIPSDQYAYWTRGTDFPSSPNSVFKKGHGYSKQSGSSGHSFDPFWWIYIHSYPANIVPPTQSVPADPANPQPPTPATPGVPM